MAAAGRQARVGASAELAVVADDVVQVVNVMEGLNRFRFGSDPERLTAWESASNMLATPRGGAGKPGPAGPPAAGGEVRPAA